MSYRSFTIEQILALLADGPSRIAALTAGLEAEQLAIRPGDGKWSAIDVLAHLRSCADVWGNCIVTILAEEKPTIRAINPRSWVRQTDYPTLPFRRSFDDYGVQRSELLALLRSLPQESWYRTATVTGAGNPLERTVHFYAQWLAGHERTHFKQFKQIAAEVRPRS